MENNLEQNKQIVREYLDLIIQNKIDEAYEKFINMDGKHHNIFTPAGFPALKQGMQQNETEMPEKQFEIKRIVAEDDIVVTYSSMKFKPEDAGMSVIHIFKLADGKIIEMWDCSQQLPAEPINTDGAF